MKEATTVLSATVLVARLPIQLILVLVRIQLHCSMSIASIVSIIVWCCTVYTVHVADPPRVTSHPCESKGVVPGNAVIFTAEATGTEPLNYHWEWKPAMGDGNWQLCDAERFPAADSSTLIIASVQKWNEGSYHCVVSNCAGSQTSKPAQLSVGKNPIITQLEYVAWLWWCIDTFCICHIADPPRITIHAQSLEDAIQGKSAKFTVQATGIHPLNYQWHWKPSKKGGGSEEWQPCDAEWSDGPTLTIPSVQKSNEGCYRCIISNCAGSQASNPVELSIGKNLTIVC